MKNGIAILMVSYNRPRYTELSLKRLLDSCDRGVEIWLWHNGMDSETLEIVQSYRSHPLVRQFYHSEKNVKLTLPTNWLWENSDAALLGKVDDDCLVPDGWIDTLSAAHEMNANLGVIGCWHFLQEDTNEDLLKGRVFDIRGHRILKNCWIGGSGYLMKRTAQRQMGLLSEGQSWPKYVLRLSGAGWINGWYYPFLYQEHMDDPRSPHTQLRTDEDVRRMRGLTAQRHGVDSVAQVLARQQEGLREILTSSLDPRDYFGWRARGYRAAAHLAKRIGILGK